jgi:hypothetical protein
MRSSLGSSSENLRERSGGVGNVSSSPASSPSSFRSPREEYSSPYPDRDNSKSNLTRRQSSASLHSAVTCKNACWALLALLAVGAAVMLILFDWGALDDSGDSSYSSTPLRIRRGLGGRKRRGEEQQGDAPPAAALQPAPAEADAPAEAQMLAPAEGALAADLERKRVIVLYSEGSRINTGVWPAWGGRDPNTATLAWAAAGVAVNKECPVSCIISHDNSMIESADAVIIETVNHPKFGLGNQPFQWPPGGRSNPRAASIAAGASRPWDESGRSPLVIPASLPALGTFYYEPDANYPGFGYRDSGIAEKTHFSVTAHDDSTLQVTLVCPWGRPVPVFLAPAPMAAKQPGRLLAYFSEHGVAERYRTIVDELFAAAGPEVVHAFSHKRNRETPPEAGGDPFALSTKLDFLSTYRFLLITDGAEQADYLSPEWSQAFLAGVVPIYGGAPNAAAYAPGPRSYLSLADFSSGAALWEYIRAFDGSREGADAAYARFFDWKWGAQTAWEADEHGQSNVLGTGRGIARGTDASAALAAVVRWGRPPAPPAPGGDVAAAAAAARDAAAEGVSEPFAYDAALAWRIYRLRLDSCVHYAECRLCELVTKVT